MDREGWFLAWALIITVLFTIVVFFYVMDKSFLNGRLNTCLYNGYSDYTETRYGGFCVGLNKSKEPFFVPYDEVVTE